MATSVLNNFLSNFPGLNKQFLGKGQKNTWLLKRLISETYGKLLE